MARGPVHPCGGRWSFARAQGVSVHVDAVALDFVPLIVHGPLSAAGRRPGPGECQNSSTMACSVLFV